MNCARCSATIAADSRFCAQCGARIAAPVPAAEIAAMGNAVERRQLTIMFYDLVGSTALAIRTDPEDFHDTIDRFHRAVVAAVEPYGARVGARVGDGGIVYFGYPLAQEDAAECAVLAGLAAVEAAAGVALPDGGRAQVRIGVATGHVVVGRLDEGNDGNAAVGRVTSLVARLQTVAPAGRVAIAEATRRLLGSLFTLDDMGVVEAKGFADPVRGWLVVGRATENRFAALGCGDTSPLIGREHERARLEAAWREVATSGGRIAVLSGEAGVGKSHLAADFVRNPGPSGDAPTAHISLFCSPHGQHSPLRPFIVQLQRADEQARLAANTQRAGTLFAPETSAEEASLLRALIDRDAGLVGSLAGLTSAERLDRTIDAIIRQVHLIARRRPLLLLFEDAHWADPTTLRLLDRVVRSAGQARAMMVITARPEFRPDWITLPNVDFIELSPLADADGAALISRISARRLSPAVQRAILRRADGLPLFLQELTRSMVEAVAATPALTAGTSADLPSTLQDSLLARLDRLGPAKEILQAGSVVGREFSRRLLGRVTDRTAAEQEAALGRLIDAGLIQPEGDSFRFRHVLMQEAAYATLLRGERQRLNARLIAALEGDCADDVAAEPEHMAHYADEAGMPAAAADYWLRAGLAAMAQSAMPEAIARLRRGLAAAEGLPEDPDRWRHELALQLAHGKALIATIGYAAPLIGETFARAKALCEATGEQQQLLAALHGLWVHDLLCARLGLARTRADELLQIAEERKDPVWTLIGCRAQGVIGYARGEFERSRRFLERALALFDPARRPAYAQILTDDARVVMQVYLSWSLTYLGERDLARHHRDAAVAEAHALNQPYSLAHALNGQVLTMLWMGETDLVPAPLDELDALTARHEIGYFAAAATIMRGQYLVRTRRLADGIDTLRRGIDAYRASRSVLYLPTFLMWLADALGDAGRAAEGVAVIEEARALMAATGMANDAVEVERVRLKLHRPLEDDAAVVELRAGAGAWRR